MTEAANIPTTGGLKVARTILILIGGVGTVGALALLVTTVKPQSLFGLAIWLLGALVLHDGILSPLLFVGQRLLHRVGKRLPGGALAIIQATVLVGGIITLVVVPEIWAQNRGARNSSVLNMPYALHLFFAWVALSVIMVALLVIMRLTAARRQAQRAQTAAPEPAPEIEQAPGVSASPVSRQRWVTFGAAALGITLMIIGVVVWTRRAQR